MTSLRPTSLYIKRHSTTGLLYFGKTVTDVDNYLGSGTYWLRHITKYGRDHVQTIWTKQFDDEYELVSFAIAFSILYDIVKSDSWANLTIETGLDGAVVLTEETKAKMSAAHKGKPKPPQTAEHVEKRAATMRGKPILEERRARISASKLGKKRGPYKPRRK